MPENSVLFNQSVKKIISEMIYKQYSPKEIDAGSKYCVELLTALNYHHTPSSDIQVTRRIFFVEEISTFLVLSDFVFALHFKDGRFPEAVYTSYLSFVSNTISGLILDCLNSGDSGDSPHVRLLLGLSIMLSHPMN